MVLIYPWSNTMVDTSPLPHIYGVDPLWYFRTSASTLSALLHINSIEVAKSEVIRG
jgi:hypothetical protein